MRWIPFLLLSAPLFGLPTDYYHHEELPSAQPKSVDQMVKTDKKIHQEVSTLLHDFFPQEKIRVSVSQGLVTLKGSVENQDIKDEVEYRIRNIEGVKNVNNFLNKKE
jgi:osmotically-inducible protein OsmY